jgi:hypothetical protein
MLRQKWLTQAMAAGMCGDDGVRQPASYVCVGLLMHCEVTQ